jgi:hypothetical protein
VPLTVGPIKGPGTGSVWFVVPVLSVLAFCGREWARKEGEVLGGGRGDTVLRTKHGRFEFERVLWRNFSRHSQIRQVGIFMSKSLLCLAILPSN